MTPIEFRVSRSKVIRGIHVTQTFLVYNEIEYVRLVRTGIRTSFMLFLSYR